MSCRLCFAALAATLVLAACGQAPGPPPVADAVPPPGNLGASSGGAALPPPPPGAAPNSFDGSYAGQGFLIVAPGGQLGCPTSMPVYGMVVTNNFVRFGDYRGPVGPNGEVNLPFRNTWIEGRFGAGRFEGTLFQPFPGCRYRFSLARTN
jgi:hypothetical protein